MYCKTFYHFKFLLLIFNVLSLVTCGSLQKINPLGTKESNVKIFKAIRISNTNDFEGVLKLKKNSVASYSFQYKDGKLTDIYYGVNKTPLEDDYFGAWRINFVEEENAKKIFFYNRKKIWFNSYTI